MEAAYVGMMRAVRHCWYGTPGVHGVDYDKQDRWGIDIEGACAEKLVAKVLNLYWTGLLDGKDSGADVGGYGVRSTRHPNGCLLIHPKDADDRIFILVVCPVPYQRIAGWILARDAKKPQWWKKTEGREACWWTPQTALKKIELLRRNDGNHGSDDPDDSAFRKQVYSVPLGSKEKAP